MHETHEMAQTSLQKLSLSQTARRRLLTCPREPLFLADWDRVLMIHFEIDKEQLQQAVPFALDLHNGRAFVSVVAFTMRSMRPRFGGRLTALLMRPIATHEFLNVRTYVRNGDETGIFFLAEWLSNRLSVALGPRVFGLPYRYGKLNYEHSWKTRRFAGVVAEGDAGGSFEYSGRADSERELTECSADSLEEWLMERYTAFTGSKGRARFFRVWHPPWRQISAQVTIKRAGLLEKSWPFFHSAKLIGSNFSPGLSDVLMGWLHKALRLQQFLW